MVVQVPLMSKHVQQSQKIVNEIEQMLGERMRETLRLDPIDTLPESWSALIDAIDAQIDAKNAEAIGGAGAEPGTVPNEKFRILNS